MEAGGAQAPTPVGSCRPALPRQAGSSLVPHHTTAPPSPPARRPRRLCQHAIMVAPKSAAHDFHGRPFAAAGTRAGTPAQARPCHARANHTGRLWPMPDTLHPSPMPLPPPRHGPSQAARQERGRGAAAPIASHAASCPLVASARLAATTRRASRQPYMATRDLPCHDL